jgi:hypothetical protein
VLLLGAAAKKKKLLAVPAPAPPPTTTDVDPPAATKEIKAGLSSSQETKEPEPVTPVKKAAATKETKKKQEIPPPAPKPKSKTAAGGTKRKKEEEPEEEAAAVAGEKESKRSTKKQKTTDLRDECKEMMRKLDKSDTVVDLKAMTDLAGRVVKNMNMNQLVAIKKPFEGFAPALYQYDMGFIRAQAQAMDDEEDIVVPLCKEIKGYFIEQQGTAIKIAMQGPADKCLDVIGERFAKSKWNAMLIETCMLHEPAGKKLMDIASMLPKDKSTVADFDRMTRQAAIASSTSSSSTESRSSSSSSSSSGKPRVVDCESLV